MFNHAPKGYICPLCLAANGIENEHTMMKQADIVYKDCELMVCINSKFIKNNPGHLIIVPVEHYENLYELPESIAIKIMVMTQKVSVALKKLRQCDGVTLLQNNEPASEQHAFHYHLHLFPRFHHDQFHQNLLHTLAATPEERKPYADKFRKYFNNSEDL